MLIEVYSSDHFVLIFFQLSIRQRWEERKVASEIESDERGHQVQGPDVSRGHGEQKQQKSLRSGHQDYTVLSPQLVTDGPPRDAADSIGQTEENGH